ncbi:SCP2 sterol-binding domain-containing protein [Thiotrichales bacterium 19S3-7]|nr:SCP2 sterol-binding domain-containing protein [Thiotrichales bacterium 19S3-7]MCF6802997.1 SCP2 sterol-binding domain-containing protein [Thiotrichales bacterium 19S3-11]
MIYTFIPAFEKVINRIIRFDPQSETLINRLNGESILLRITDFNITVIVKALSNEIQLSPYTDGDTFNAELSATLPSFIKAAISDMPQMLFYSKEIKLKGSLKTVLAWNRFYLALAPELSFWLEPYLGKSMTYHLGQPLKWLKSALISLKEKSSTELSEYLKEELLLFPPKEQSEDFSHDILMTSISAERVEHKFNCLIKGLKNE